MVIDDHEWYNMKEVNEATASFFRQKIREEKFNSEYGLSSHKKRFISGGLSK